MINVCDTQYDNSIDITSVRIVPMVKPFGEHGTDRARQEIIQKCNMTQLTKRKLLY